jgi:hypothetical protein
MTICLWQESISNAVETTDQCSIHLKGTNAPTGKSEHIDPYQFVRWFLFQKIYPGYRAICFRELLNSSLDSPHLVSTSIDRTATCSKLRIDCRAAHRAACRLHIWPEWCEIHAQIEAGRTGRGCRWSMTWTEHFGEKLTSLNCQQGDNATKNLLRKGDMSSS